MTMAMVPAGEEGRPLPVVKGETSAAAVAAREKAAIEARFLVAMHRLRVPDTARLRILAACQRSRFAETAKYSKPVAGQKIIGPSIRFVEEALRCWGNVDIQVSVVFDDDEKRIMRVVGLDLETGAGYALDTPPILKSVERRNPKQGDEVLGSRENSQGATVYRIRATEDDLLNKTNAAVSKTIRNVGLRLLPSDIVEEAMEAVDETLRHQDERDPAGVRKRLVQAFYQIGVMPDALVKLLGHPLESITPAELAMLRTVFTALKDGETTWAEVQETFGAEGRPAVGGDASGRAPKTEALRERLARNRVPKGEPPAAQAPPDDASDEALQREAAELLRREGGA
ncbi:MAG: hypothetical protein IPM13_17620 [Phycisphaerales bacterium]|nr:hypothetical protein [Phycisphaerales bacterium]